MEKSISVMNVENQVDITKNKLYLSGIEMSLFANQGEKKSTYLAIICFKVISEANTLPVTAAAYQKSKKWNENTATVTPTQ